MNSGYKYFLLALTLCASPALAIEEPTHLFTVSYLQAEQAASAALADNGVAEKVAAHINGRKDEVLYSYGKPMTVEARGLQFNKSSSHWSANLLVISGGEVITALPVSGRFEALAEVPVLRRNVQNGQVIEAQDIEIRDMPIRQVRSDTVTDMASLIGRSPAHSITANRPIRVHEVSLPPLVKRNGLVQMHYRATGMEITTTGQAMEDGAKGEFIKVKNLSSKKVVQAMVEDVASVSVTPPSEKMEISVKTVGDLYATN